MSELQYRVRCDDCDISEDYERKKSAVLRMVEHAKETSHDSVVREPGEYAVEQMPAADELFGGGQ